MWVVATQKIRPAACFESQEQGVQKFDSLVKTKLFMKFLEVLLSWVLDLIFQRSVGLNTQFSSVTQGVLYRNVLK